MNSIVLDNSMSQQAWNYALNISMGKIFSMQEQICFKNFVYLYMCKSPIVNLKPKKEIGRCDPFLHLVYNQNDSSAVPVSTEQIYTYNDDEIFDLFTYSLAENAADWVTFAVFQLSSRTYTVNETLSSHYHNDCIFNQYASRIVDWRERLNEAGENLVDNNMSEEQKAIINLFAEKVELIIDNIPHELKSGNVLFSIQGAELKRVIAAFAFTWYKRGLSYQMSTNVKKPQHFLHVLRTTTPNTQEHKDLDKLIEVNAKSAYNNLITENEPDWVSIIELLIREKIFNSGESIDIGKLVEFMQNIRGIYNKDEYKDALKKKNKSSRDMLVKDWVHLSGVDVVSNGGLASDAVKLQALFCLIALIPAGLSFYRSYKHGSGDWHSLQKAAIIASGVFALNQTVKSLSDIPESLNKSGYLRKLRRRKIIPRSIYYRYFDLPASLPK